MRKKTFKKKQVSRLRQMIRFADHLSPLEMTGEWRERVHFSLGIFRGLVDGSGSCKVALNFGGCAGSARCLRFTFFGMAEADALPKACSIGSLKKKQVSRLRQMIRFADHLSALGMTGGWRGRVHLFPSISRLYSTRQA